MALPTTPKIPLPVSTGQDLVVDFQNVDPSSGAAVDYPAGASVTLTIQAASPVVADAVISGNHAVCFVESSVMDGIPGFTTYRVNAVVPGGLGTPATVSVTICNGTLVRSDGN